VEPLIAGFQLSRESSTIVYTMTTKNENNRSKEVISGGMTYDYLSLSGFSQKVQRSTELTPKS
jgi:hypothetical protein